MILSLQQAASSSGHDARLQLANAFDDKTDKLLCLTNRTLSIEDSSSLPGEQTTMRSSHCFDRAFMGARFSAMGLLSIPNELDVVLKEATPRTQPLREQWNGRLKTTNGRQLIADAIAKSIRANRSIYLLESYSSEADKQEFNGAWASGRREIMRSLTHNLKLRFLGETKGERLWKIDSGA